MDRRALILGVLAVASAVVAISGVLASRTDFAWGFAIGTAIGAVVSWLATRGAY